MNSYRCKDCGAIFSEPLHVTERTYQDPYGVPFEDHYLVCPFCSSTEYETLGVCPKCRKAMPEGSKLCLKCQKALRIRFSTFVYGLEPCEVDQLDEWLEGSSVQDIKEGST